jgi:DNA-binding transcriptional MerR regulator
MDMDLVAKLKSIDCEFLAGETGKIMGLSTRSVSSWCEQGLLIAPTAGRGDRRRFSALQLVEIGIIRKMSEAGLPLARVRWVMDFLRNYDLQRLLANEELHIAVPPMGEASAKIIINWSKGSDNEKARLLEWLFSIESDRFFVFDLRSVAKTVLDNL